MTEERAWIMDENLLDRLRLRKVLMASRPIEHILELESGQGVIDAFADLMRGERKPSLLLLRLDGAAGTGWDFLEYYDGLEVDFGIDIYAIIHPRDEEAKIRGQRYGCIKKFVEKPISPDVFLP